MPRTSRTPPELVIVTAFYKRHDLSRLWLEHTCALGVPVVAAVDVGDRRHAEMCGERGVDVVTHVGEPLAAKFNAAVIRVHDHFPGFGIMILGSDDFVASGHVESARYALQHYDYVLPEQVAMLEVRSRLAMVLTQDDRASRLFGAGRAVSSAVVRALRGRLWDTNKRRGLDSNSHRVVHAEGFSPYVLRSPLHPVCDVKAGVNLWRYEHYKSRGVPCTVDHALWMVDGMMRRRILALCHPQIR